MSEIADFLRARLLERLALAEAARDGGEGSWQQEDADRYPGRIVDESGNLVTFNVSAPSDEQGAHIAANDPAAVIADFDAKLALVKHMEDTLKFAEGDTEVDHYGALNAAERALCLLAQPFAGHPDHKGEEWAP